jgi:hypothetical protein
MTYTKKCDYPVCNGGKMPDGSKCPNCNGLGFTIMRSNDELKPVTVTPDPATGPKWFQVVIALLAAIAAVASAYSSYQSHDNSQSLEKVHAVQEDNSARIKEIHKDVKATQNMIQ